jgi:N-methylhydantoinase A
VTDASVVLGYLNPEWFAGGAMELDADAAHRALEEFGARLGLDGVEAAAGIHRVINSKMADEIRRVSVKRGYDPRDFALVALGGAGSLHAGRLAAELNLPTVIVPPVPGVLSALGLLMASVEHDSVETVAVPAANADPASIEAAFGRLEERVAGLMTADGVPRGAAVTSRLVDMRYIGQGYTLEVPCPASIGEAELAGIVDAFHAIHLRIYGHAHSDAETELVNVRVVQAWSLPSPPLSFPPGRDRPPGDRTRQAYFDECRGYVDTPVHDRAALGPGDEVRGPAIVEQADTTLVVYPGQRATVSAAGALVLNVKTANREVVEAGDVW